MKFLRIMGLLFSLGYLNLIKHTMIPGKVITSIEFMRILFIIIAIVYFLFAWIFLTIFILAFDDTGQFLRIGIQYAPLHALYGLFFTPMAMLLLPELFLLVMWLENEIHHSHTRKRPPSGEDKH